jgi:primase-polymerase (primpol)-like protein
MSSRTATRSPQCQHCTGRLPNLARADARFCSSACRQAAYRERRAAETGGMPREMTQKARWVRYSARKVPLTTHGKPASSTNPATWSDFPRVHRSRVGVGPGYVLAKQDGIVCLDLDHVVREDGTLVEWAAALLQLVPATYIEVSRSGRGLHVFGKGTLPGRGRRWSYADGTGLEVYVDARYIAMTGQRWKDAPTSLADLGEVLATLV